MGDFHQDTWDGLRAKGHTVGPVYVQDGQGGAPAHQFVTVDGVAMPVEWAADLNAGRVSLPEIVERVKS